MGPWPSKVAAVSVQKVMLAPYMQCGMAIGNCVFGGRPNLKEAPSL